MARMVVMQVSLEARALLLLGTSTGNGGEVVEFYYGSGGAGSSICSSNMQEQPGLVMVPVVEVDTFISVIPILM